MSGKVLINSVYSKIRIRFVQVMFQNIPFRTFLTHAVSSVLLTPFSHTKCFQYPLTTKLFTNVTSMTCKQHYCSIWEDITYFPYLLPLDLDILGQNRRCKLWYLNTGLLDFFSVSYYCFSQGSQNWILLRMDSILHQTLTNL